MFSACRRAVLSRSSNLAWQTSLLRLGCPFVLAVDAVPLHPAPSEPEDRTIAQADPSPSRRGGYAAFIRKQKYDALLEYLDEKGSNPNWIWTCYVDLLDFSRDDPVPLEIHQRVLRKCTHERHVARKAFVYNLHARGRRRLLENPHPHEGRFLTVINNIRRARLSPSLDDYEFILDQFAAVGHYIAAAQVLQEVVKSGLGTRTRIFGLCLQAIAFRLSLPCPEADRPKVREQCSRLCLHIASIIRKRKGRVPSACLDLVLRIMKDTDNPDVFKSLLKIAYGVDLDYLDRHALASDNALGEPEPFSTAALTTLVELLGRQKQASRLVAAFEVLTTPLPVNPAEIQLRSFDDDEDDWPVPTSPTTKSKPLPFARPNTTTYNTLIRQFAHLRETTLAKHYLLQALELDYASSAKLLSDLQAGSSASVCPPKVRVNADTFLCVFGLGKRSNNLGLIKWLLPHFRMAVRRKKQDFVYCSWMMDPSRADEPQTPPQRHPAGLLGEYGLTKENSSTSNPSESVSVPVQATTTPGGDSPVSFFTTSSNSAMHLADEARPHPRLDDTLEPAPSLGEIAAKRFDIAAHVQVLQRDIAGMKRLDKRIGRALTRLHIRRKEALGRRIWAGKNIFVRRARKRIQVTREAWMEMVNFDRKKPRRKSEPITSAVSDAADTSTSTS